MAAKVRNAEFEEMSLDDKMRVFEETALPYVDSLYRTALRLTRNEKDAEDLVQEALFRAYKSFAQFQLGTNCKAWLFKIMTNLHINRSKKKSRRPNKVSFDDIEDYYLYNKITQVNESGLVTTVEDEVLQSFLDSEIKEAVEKLPDDFKVTVILADIEGFRYQEIADILQCPIGTVRSRLSRGRKLLEKYLWDYARDKMFTEGSCTVDSCDNAVTQLVDYLHSELDTGAEKQIKVHLGECTACCSRFEFEEKLSDLIHEKGIAEHAPDSVKKNLLKRLKSLL